MGLFYAMKDTEELGMFVFFPTKLLEVLTPRQAVIMGMIIGMAKKSGYAYPTNKTISSILNMTPITVQRELAYLEAAGFIRRELLRNEKLEVLSRRIYPSIGLDGGVVSELRGGVISELTPPSPQICNNYIYNTKDINNKSILSFDDAWTLYTKKGVKKTAQNAWAKLKESDREFLTQFIPKYIENHKQAEKLDFLPHFATFLNQRRFNDELPYKLKLQPQTTTPKPLKASLHDE